MAAEADSTIGPLLTPVAELGEGWSAEELAYAYIRQRFDELVAEGKLEDLGGGMYRNVEPDETTAA